MRDTSRERQIDSNEGDDRDAGDFEIVSIGWGEAGRPASGFRLALVAGLLFVVCLVVFNVRAVLWRPYQLEGQPPPDGLTRVAGVVHVHTTLSDGRATPAEVTEAAEAAGLSFIVITDHNTLDAKSVAGYHGELLVLVGAETSTEAGHLLGLGIRDPVFRFSGDARDTLEDISSLGGTSVVAHPMSPREDFRWSGWQLPGSWGVELLNLDSLLRTAGWGKILQALVLSGLNPRHAALRVMTSPAATLARWDSQLAERDVAGIAGTDAHLWYESLFGIAKTFVLLDAPLSGDPTRDRAAILRALAGGRSYIGVDGLAPAGDFFAFVEGGEQRWHLGDTVPPAPNLTLRAGGRLPRAARLRVLKDGVLVAEAEHSIRLTSLTRGVYRVEVRLPGWDVPWILANPIYVFEPDEAQTRARRARWPADPPPPALVDVLDSFDRSSTFHTEFDASSSLTFELVAPDGPEHGQGIGRMQFRLGSADTEHPNPVCALVSRKNRDLSGRAGLAFSVKADGIYRLWVHVRDENPASPFEGAEGWSDSFRTTTEWRRITVPFSVMQSRDPNSDGQLDLDEIRVLAFALTPGTVKSGTAGTIWFDNLGVY